MNLRQFSSSVLSMKKKNRDALSLEEKGFRPFEAAEEREASMAGLGRRGECQVHENVQIEIKNFLGTY